MKHLFVGYEIAKKLKHSGFTEYCLAVLANEVDGLWTTKNKNTDGDYVLVGGCPQRGVSAPLYSQVIDYFIGKDIFIEIYCNASGYGYILTKTNGTTIKEIEDDIFFDSYYKALEKGIEEALKLI